jgi:hypothetical protein
MHRGHASRLCGGGGLGEKALDRVAPLALQVPRHAVVDARRREHAHLLDEAQLGGTRSQLGGRRSQLGGRRSQLGGRRSQLGGAQRGGRAHLHRRCLRRDLLDPLRRRNLRNLRAELRRDLQRNLRRELAQLLPAEEDRVRALVERLGVG